jgi:nucleoside-triphosphatase
MDRTGPHILVTGAPGVGKTTLVRKVADELAPRGLLGFYSTEIREQGERLGFEPVSFRGERALLAHVKISGPPRVGKYGVQIDGLDRFLDQIPKPRRGIGLFVIDEIGKMECLSRRFHELVRLVLDSSAPVLATVALKGGGLIQEVKERPDLELVEITKRTRDSTALEMIRRLAP